MFKKSDCFLLSLTFFIIILVIQVEAMGLNIDIAHFSQKVALMLYLNSEKA